MMSTMITSANTPEVATRTCTLARGHSQSERDRPGGQRARIVASVLLDL